MSNDSPDNVWDVRFEQVNCTIEAAIKTKGGIVFGGIGKKKNSNLARVVTSFSHLYDGKLQNPILPDNENPLVEAFIYGDLPAGNEKKPKEALKRYCGQIADAMENLMATSFSADDRKTTVIKSLKKDINAFFRDCQYDYEFVNIKKEVERIKYKVQDAENKRKRQMRWEKIKESIKNAFNLDHEKKTFPSYVLTEADRAMKDAQYRKNADGTKPQYLKMDTRFCRTKEAEERRRKSRNLKIAILIASIVFSIFVAGGQAAIATYVLSGAMFYVIGAAALLTNFTLILNSTKPILLKIFKRTMFRGLSRGAGIMLFLHMLFSIATGVVSAALVLGSFLGVFGYAIPTMLTAPGGVIFLAIVVTVATFVGMTALYFDVGVDLAHKLKGHTLKDKKDEKTGRIKKGLISIAQAKISKFFKVPKQNDLAIKLANKIIALEAAKDAQYDAKIKLLEKKISIAEKTHVARHWLTVSFTILFFPLALIFSLVVTLALLKVSYKDTLPLLHNTLKFTKKVAEGLSMFLTYVPALVVNYGLYNQSLFEASSFFAQKLGKLTAGIGSTFANISLFFKENRDNVGPAFKEACRDAYNTVKENPTKIVYPILRAAFLGFCSLLVVLNGQGNAALYRDEGTIISKFLTYWAAFFGSATLNFMAIDALVAEQQIPIKRFNLKSTYQHLSDKLGDRPNESGNDDDFGHDAETSSEDGNDNNEKKPLILEIDRNPSKLARKYGTLHYGRKEGLRKRTSPLLTKATLDSYEKGKREMNVVEL